MLSPATLAELDAFLLELNRASAEVILPLFRAEHGLEDKGKAGAFDPVTAADRGAEAAIRALIAKHHPGHGVIGEEYGQDRPDAEYVWVLDPIDGTKSFICGMPVWGTLIALTRRGEPIYGLMHQPFTREHFSGDGKGARYRGPAGDRALRVRPCTSLQEAILATTSPLLMNADDRRAFGRVENAVRLSRYGGDCYAYCVLAAGHVDLIIETELKPHDVLALIPIIEGAGGVITTWENGPPHRGGRIVAAGDRRVHAQALELLKG